MAAKCEIEPETWSRWVKAGKAPQPVKIGGAHRWPAELVDDWIKRLIKER